MKKYSIGYKDSYGAFIKVWDEKGATKKFESIEECEKYIEASDYLKLRQCKIMVGWKVEKIIEKVNA